MKQKLTSKQIAALSRIINNETVQIKQNRTDAAPAAKGNLIRTGVHPSGGRYAVSDGACLVILDESPDFPIANRNDAYEKRIRAAEERGDYWLVDERVDIKTIRNAAHMKRCAPADAPSMEVSCKTASGRLISGVFNAQYLLNVVEAVGTGAMIYLGYHDRSKMTFPTLVVYPKNWMERGTSIIGFLMPRRA